MESPKISLSSAESELMQNAGVILTKNSVLEKIGNLLSVVVEWQTHRIKEAGIGAGDIFLSPPKISRGENYLGLPYRILDFPRQSGADGLFFIRSMFWWGNFFSSTLHLSGKYKEMHADRIIQNKPVLDAHFVGVNADPWVHHFGPGNFLPLNTMTTEAFAANLKKGDHLKIGMKWPLQDWEAAPRLMYGNWLEMLRLCGLIA